MVAGVGGYGRTCTTVRGQTAEDRLGSRPGVRRISESHFPGAVALGGFSFHIQKSQTFFFPKIIYKSIPKFKKIESNFLQNALSIMQDAVQTIV